MGSQAASQIVRTMSAAEPNAARTDRILPVVRWVAAVVAFPLVLDHLGLGPESKLIFSLARWPLLFLILWGALGLLYRFGPSREHRRWEWLNAGTLGSG